MDKQKELLQAMINIEKTIGKLYQVYSTIFDNKDFWLGLSREEEGHAKVIADLSAKVDKEPIYVDDNRFKLAPINFFIKSVEDKIQQAQDGSVNIIDALGAAWNIENALIEKECYQIYQADSEDFKSMLEALRLGTEVHINRVKQELDKYKNINN